jgi:cyclopropane-fatty-acyl-phospholipid synthase
LGGRLEAAHDRVLRHVDEPTYRVWRLYMAGCAHGFARNRTSVFQALLSKDDSLGRSHLPWTRADLYQD